MQLKFIHLAAWRKRPLPLETNLRAKIHGFFFGQGNQNPYPNHQIVAIISLSGIFGLVFTLVCLKRLSLKADQKILGFSSLIAQNSFFIQKLDKAGLHSRANNLKLDFS
ncbi:hypothetical protein ZMO1_ZMO2062 [Zymomonas mobilis subsp. mobilis ZM4 = ATCC 31821]|nr:hypothetical protein ZMO1_ZMO2062 [Zymomonas mobilis subsp. mobilis ZM4 = ATCC 31821]HCE37973.1 hypothetical protein [Zymomonas mobilis]